MAQTMTRVSTPPPVRSAPRVKLPWPASIYQTAVGKKWVMGLTGVALLGFIVVHMIGNLHLYEGPLEIHEYAETLRDLGTKLVPRTWLLWAMRIGLIIAFGLHIHSAYSLSRMSLAAGQPTHKSGDGRRRLQTLGAGAQRYPGGRNYIAANFASRTMRWTGPIIGLYLFYHLADLTWGWFNPDFVRGDPYHNVSESLSSIPVAILYIVANVALAVHIFHGTWSMFQSLGVNSPRYNHLRRYLASGLAGIILVGNLSFPIFVQAGVIDDDGRSFVEELERQEAAEGEEG